MKCRLILFFLLLAVCLACGDGLDNPVDVSTIETDISSLTSRVDVVETNAFLKSEGGNSGAGTYDFSVGTIRGGAPLVASDLTPMQYVDNKVSQFATWYMLGSVTSDVAGSGCYTLSEEVTESNLVTLSYSSVTALQYMACFITVSNEPGITELQAHSYLVHSHINKSHPSQELTVKWELYLRNNSDVDYLEVDVTPVITLTDRPDDYSIFITVRTNIPMAIDDRLVLKCKVVSVTGNQSVDIYTEGNRIAFFRGNGGISAEIDPLSIHFNGDNAMTGDLNMGSQSITNAVDGRFSGDLFADELRGTAGVTMIDISSGTIQDVSTGANSVDAQSRILVDSNTGNSLDWGRRIFYGTNNVSVFTWTTNGIRPTSSNLFDNGSVLFPWRIIYGNDVREGDTNILAAAISAQATADAALPRVGGDANPMLGNLNMGTYAITNVSTNSIIFTDGSSITIAGTNIFFLTSGGETHRLDGYEYQEIFINANQGNISTLDGQMTGVDNRSKQNQNNTMINALRIAVNGASTKSELSAGFDDYYTDQSGIDLSTGSNYVYDAGADIYTNVLNDVGMSLITSMEVYWKCDDDAESTNVIDFLGNYTTTFQDGSNTSTITTSGKLDKAFELVGSGYGGAGHNSYFKTSVNMTAYPTMTVAAWVWSPTSRGDQGGIFSIGDPDNQEALATYWHQDRSFRMHYDDGPRARTWTTDSTYTSLNDEWVFIVFVFTQGAVGQIYVNSIKVASSTTLSDGAEPTDSVTESTVFAGQLGGTQRYFQWEGKIDQVLVWTNRALGQGAVDFMYNSTVGTTNTTTPSVFSYMDLISTNWINASAIPATGKGLFLIEDVSGDSTINVDLKAYISNDDGGNWDELTLTLDSFFDVNASVYVGTNVFSGSDTQMVYRIKTFNDKLFKIHGSSLLWEE